MFVILRDPFHLVMVPTSPFCFQNRNYKLTDDGQSLCSYTLMKLLHAVNIFIHH